MADVTAKPASSGPGILQVFLTLKKSSMLSQDILEKWLDDVYIPALVETGVIKSAWRFKAANSDYDKPNMVIYKIPDMSTEQLQKLHSVPVTSSLFPTDEPVISFVENDSRILSFVQLYETIKQPEDAATTIIYAAMEPQPGGEADLDAWYRDEHNQQMSEQPGWQRTTRFSLLRQHKSNENASDAPSFLAIHEFGEGNKIGKDVEPLDPMTEWTKRCMSKAKAIDAGVYHKVKSFGKANS